MRAAAVVALGYDYPSESSLPRLRQAVEADLQGTAQRRMRRFVSAIEKLTLTEWEELHTRTLDLSPLFVPYVGHVIWGENYRRGEFMADLKRQMELCDVDLRGELPDHIGTVLRYLAVAPNPFVDLVTVLPEAVNSMRSAIRIAESSNPYRHVVGATQSVVENETPVSIGGRS